MSDFRSNLRARHSSHLSKTPTSSDGYNYSKSDLNVTIPSSSFTSRSTRYTDLHQRTDSSAHGEYYKKYEHDEIPVKECSIRSNNNESLTNADIDRLETRVYSNVSQELQTDESSLVSLESNIKFFKLTVEKIFENFNTTMKDYELYKKRFHEILERSHEGKFDDMGDFIKEMFENIMSDSSTHSVNTNEKDPSCGDTYSERDTDVMEAYKNENYHTDSVADEKTTSGNECLKIDELINIFLLDGNPCVRIRLNDRNLLSEINLKENKLKTTSHIASADNLRIYNSKQNAVDQYYMSEQLEDIPERNIPVKVSNGKKNIYLNEDFVPNCESSDTAKSFLSKICNILCKKFRKSL